MPIKPETKALRELNAKLKLLRGNGLEVPCANLTDMADAPEAWMTSTCDECPARRACGAYGRAAKADGVWGGEMLADGESVGAAEAAA